MFNLKKYFFYCFVVMIPFGFDAQETTVVMGLPSEIDQQFGDSVINNLDVEGKNIIVLGEENHGSEYTNQINVRIIQALVEKHGFNTLIIESDFFGLYYADSVRNENSIRENVFDIWSNSIAFEGIESLYLDKKLNVFGFDSRHHGDNSSNHLVGFLQTHCNHISPDSIQLFYEITQDIVEEEFRNITLEEYNRVYFNFIKTIQAGLDSGSMEFHILSNLKNYAEQLLIERNQGTVKYVEQRELAMIKNMDFLLRKKFTNEKVIVLGATTHVQPNILSLTQHASTNVGEHIREHYPTQSLFIMPLVYSGKTQFSNYPVNKISTRGKRKTIQKELANQFDFALVDYTKKSFDKPIYKNIEVGADVSDYFIFIREEIPRRVHSVK